MRFRQRLRAGCWATRELKGRNMIERLTQRTMVLTAAVFCLAGVIDGLRQDSPSTAILFGLVFVVGAGISRQKASSRPIHVRPDLREWLDDTASLTGESIEELSNAALSSYRAGLGSHHGG